MLQGSGPVAFQVMDVYITEIIQYDAIISARLVFLSTMSLLSCVVVVALRISLCHIQLAATQQPPRA